MNAGESAADAKKRNRHHRRKRDRAAADGDEENTHVEENVEENFEETEESPLAATKSSSTVPATKSSSTVPATKSSSTVPATKSKLSQQNPTRKEKKQESTVDDAEDDKGSSEPPQQRAEAAPAVTDYHELNLNPHIVTALEKDFGFKELTGIQARALPSALAGKDLLAEAKTGAGKTLSFLIPIVENITRAGFKAVNGTAAIIIGPTRELCQQIEGVLLKLLKHFNGSITFICCIGGQNRKQEGFKLASGSMIVVSSPGRLLDHLKLTKDWNTRNLLMLAVDEADRVLDNGFEDDLREIVGLLPSKRQTFLFSATQTTRVEQLARISFYRPPVFISMKSKDDKATVDTLEQGYVMCPSEHRLALLYHFVKRNLNKKVIVFFSSRNSVSFHCELFNYIDVPCVAFHGKQKQHQRSATYMQFCNAPSGVLFTTDVAARGLDIPKVDWIVQFDPSDDPVKYIHRVGRTARAGRCGNALMFLLPSEQLFLKYLYDDAHVSVNEYTFNMEKVTQGVQEELQKLVMSNYYLRTSARQAYEGYLLAYSSTQLKNVFDVQKLDLAKVARGFALTDPPPVKIDLSQSAAHLNKKARKDFKQSQMSKNPERKKGVAPAKNVSGEW